MALEYTYDDQGNLQLTPDILNRRRALALALVRQGMDTSPIQHWTQGAARLANTLVGGLQLRGADREDKSMRAQDASSLSEGINAYLQSQRAKPATKPSQADSTTMPSGQMGADIPFSSGGIDEKGYAKPGMLDRDYTGPVPDGAQYSPDDRDKLIRTAAFEAGDPQGRQAVAESILNRSKARGISPAEVTQQPWQYEPWMTKRSEMEGLDPNSPSYQASANAVDQALHGGTDITGGAQDFLSPGVMADRGKALPSWAQGPGQDIGGNRFFGGSPGQQQVASAMQPNRLSPAGAPEAIGAPMDISPPAQQPALPSDASMQPPVAPPGPQLAQNDQQPTGIPLIDSGQVSREEAVMKLMQVLNSPSATDQQRTTASSLIERLLVPKPPTWGVISKDPIGGEQYGWITPETKSIEAGPTNQAAASTQAMNDLQGPELLDAIQKQNPNLASTLKAMNEGQVGVKTNAKNFTQLVGLANRIWPGFDATVFTARQRIRQQLASAQPGALGGQRSILNVAIGHLKSLSDKAQEMGNAQYFPQAINTAQNIWATNVSGKARTTAYDTALHPVAEEMDKLYKGLGATEASIFEWKKNLANTNSPEQINAAIQEMSELLNSKIVEMERLWQATMGDVPLPSGQEMLNPDSQGFLDIIRDRARGMTDEDIDAAIAKKSGAQ